MVGLWIWRHTAVAYVVVALLTTTQLTAGAARDGRGLESRGLQQTQTEFTELRFLGGKSGKELCSGALLQPSVVLTSAHCASNANLNSVNVTVSTQQHEVPVLTKQTSAHPQFGAAYAFVNNVALVFLNISAMIGSSENQQQPSAWPLVSLPSSTITPAQVPAFQEIQVSAKGAASSPLANFSRDACVEDPVFASDTSVWCSYAPSENSSVGAHLPAMSDDCSPAMTETALLGSPVVVETQDENGSTGLTVMGLRLTSSCFDRQAFAYTPSVLDFITSYFQPTTSLPDLNQTVGFDTITNDIFVGKVSPGGDDLAPVALSNGSSSLLDDDVGVDISRSDKDAIIEGDPTLSKSASYIGGWPNLPSLGEFGIYAAFVTQNTTEAYNELEACVGVLIAPMFIIADGYCTQFMSEPQVVVVRDTPATQGNASSTEQQVYAITNVSRHQDYAGSLAVLELERPIDGMIPHSISRSLSKEYHVTDKSWELVSMDNIFASTRENHQIVTKQSIVRLPTTTCNVNHYEEIPFTWCVALGSESDRQDVFGFSQGFVLHDKMLVALPQCYSSICPGGLFQTASFLAGKEDWIREQTRNTALWDAVPLDKSIISHKGVDEDGNMLPKAATYAILVDGCRNSSGNGTALCSGVLIAPSFVLTTASCAVNATISHVRLGLDKHVSHDDDFEESTISVRAIHVHPGFRTKSAGDNEVNDLALLELGGMAYFVPIFLEQDDTLKMQNRTLGTSSASSENNDASTANYSWPISLSPVDGSALCVAEETSYVFSEMSRGASPPKTNIINCSLIETQLDKFQGDGLIGAFAEGDSLLGIRLSSCVRAHNGNAANTCALSPRLRSHGDLPACYARVASPSAKGFIDSVSVDHTWRVSWNAGGIGRAFPFLAKEVLAITPITTTIVPDDPGYTGSLEYDPLSSQTQVGFVVGLRKDKSGQNFCGGSLIAPSYVLTAAHCVVGGEAKYVSVGSRASAGTETELIPVKPEKVIVHPLYGKRSGISYDVAILELANQAYPAPIQLDNALAFDASTQFTLFGYGANSAESRTLSPVMRSVELPYFDRTSCAKFFPELDDSMLCAGGQPARDACTGDSGSPLVYYQDGKPVLVGVVSTGRNGCGTPGVPGIYGYVSTMQGFVNSYTAGCNWVDPNKRAPSLDSALSLSSTGTPTSGSTQPESATSARTYLDESNENQIPFEIVHSSTGVDEHQLLVVKLAVDTPPLLQDAVKAFLLGGYSMIGGTWERMSNEIRAAETTITFYSSGEMLDLMKTIAKYSFKPLNQRTNRFGTRFDETTSSANCCDRA